MLGFFLNVIMVLKSNLNIGHIGQRTHFPTTNQINFLVQFLVVEKNIMFSMSGSAVSGGWVDVLGGSFSKAEGEWKVGQV